jgi:hypothetical protein
MSKTRGAFDWAAEYLVAWCDHPFRKSVSMRYLGFGGRTLESSVIVMILSNNFEFDYIAKSIMQSQKKLLQEPAVLP